MRFAGKAMDIPALLVLDSGLGYPLLLYGIEENDDPFFTFFS